MNQLTVALVLMFALTAHAGKPCDGSGECKTGFYCNQQSNECERQSLAGEPCETSRQCKGASTCENTTDSDPNEKICTERCRTDADCLQYEDGKNKFCSTGGLATLVKGYCLPGYEEGEDCNRSPECKGKLFCKNGFCIEAAEAVQCQLDCNGPREKNPNNIKPGDTVNVIYSCTFIRNGEYGPLPIKASLRLNKKFKLGNASGESPITISGSRAIENVGKGEFSAEVQGMMTACKGDRKLCRASKRCILKA